MKDIYVKFTPDVKGESRDGSFKGQLEVTSWQHLIRQPKSATASTAGGHTAERCEHGEMIFTKDIDSTSPVLWEHCSAGKTFDEVEINFMRASGDNRINYLQIRLKHVLISSVTPSVVSEGLPTEAFGLKYAAVKWIYTQQGIDGKVQPKVEKNWSLSQNKNTYTTT